MTKQSAQESEALKHRRQAANLLYDALRFHEGNLSKRQLEVIRGILDNFVAIPDGFSLEIVKKIDRTLYGAGLDTIPGGE